MDISMLRKEQCLELASTSESSQLQLQLSSDMPLQCVGSLQVERQLQLGFICGSLPVPTDIDTMMYRTSGGMEAAIVPAISLQNDRTMAPQYRMLPSQTDLNTLLLSDVEREQILPMTTGKAPEGVHELCKKWGHSYHNQPLARKCESLAVNALAGYGDQIDIIAPVEILKKIFKIPYSKARLSIAVHRVGQTLILNTGPDVEEGENLARTKKCQAKAMERSLFLKFAKQSVRAEACDCPVQQTSEDQNSKPKPETSCTESGSDFDGEILDSNAHFRGQKYMMNDGKRNLRRNGGTSKTLDAGRDETQSNKKQSVSWNSSDTSRFSGIGSNKKSSIIGERQRDPDRIQNDSGNQKRPSNEGFLRVLFWQLEEMRMLLGSDLLLFSNEKHVAVSLHLWEVERQATPLMWLDAWLDNVMASVPELAICYHHNGIVQGYELLKTDDIFLLKGLSEDGTSFFHPHVVQQNALSVLRFLQENCKQDPGTYWLFKSAGEDLVQLFDLSAISNSRAASTKKDDKKEPLPPWSRGKGNYCLPLGILLYRVAHRLSLSQDPSERSRCANFFKKCLEVLGEQDHLFVRASAHEHVARLILKCHEELGPVLMPFMLEANEYFGSVERQPFLEHNVNSSQSTDPGTAENETSSSISTCSARFSNAYVQQSEAVGDFFVYGENSVLSKQRSILDKIDEIRKETDTSYISQTEIFAQGQNVEGNAEVQNSSLKGMAGDDSNISSGGSKTLVIPVSARLAAVHQVSQAIKALRWQRQLQDVGDKILASESKLLGANKYVHLVPVCVNGEIDCIEYCDIREYEIGPFVDQKLVQLVLLLGESYLALGQAYKDDGQLTLALKATELACSVYQAMRFHWDHNAKNTVSINQNIPGLQLAGLYTSDLPVSMKAAQPRNISQAFCQPVIHDSSVGNSVDKSLFWGQAWTLVGDIYVEYQRKEKDSSSGDNVCDGLELTQEVAKEVKRLRKKLSQNRKNCSICSLVKCTCENDRANSGNSASSSSSTGITTRQNRKHGKKTTNLLADASAIKHGDESKASSDEPGHHTSEPENSIQSNGRVDNGSFELSEVRDSKKASGGSSQAAASDANLNKEDDIFSFLQGPRAASKETNLLTAIECYDIAVLLLRRTCQGSDEIKTALRKKGWACNEIGRMKLSSGNIKAAESIFRKAISAFRDVKDITNVILIYCNIGHGQRAEAEKVISQLDSVKSSNLYEHVSKKLLEHALSLYADALKFYITAKDELKLLPEDVGCGTTDLKNEVVTQCAHTYLRLGMLLASENKKGFPNIRFSIDNRHTESPVSESMGIPISSSIDINMTANDAIRKAISFYESLGRLRVQELAFAQFQLACHHSDCCLDIIRAESKQHNEVYALQQIKRYHSLAERYWLKALKCYKPMSHPDMFLEILMRRSALSIEVSSSSSSVSMMEVALSQLLEGRHVKVGDKCPVDRYGHEEYFKPSDRVLIKFSQHLQNLLKTMLATALNMQKASSHKNSTLTKNSGQVDSTHKGEVHRLGQVVEIEKLKSMYRLALKSVHNLDIQGLYDLWISQK